MMQKHCTVSMVHVQMLYSQVVVQGALVIINIRWGHEKFSILLYKCLVVHWSIGPSNFFFLQIL